uniref:Translation elongation factor EFTu/EF1A C-terminal domain-containing protein n=1 Tax=Hippocampus comes TaxID=109280 RepID=A0A3Q2Z4V9_HIPCM
SGWEVFEICFSSLRTGEKADVQFKFLKHPEYLKLGAKVLFREGVTKGIGHVTNATAGETARSLVAQLPDADC